jgi:TPR repeat protein
MKRVEANDAASIFLLGNCYHHGSNGFQQDHTKAMELYVRAAELGCRDAHYDLGKLYRKGGNLKKSKFHYEAAAMAGDDDARHVLGNLEGKSGNMEQAVKHWMIAASAGHYNAMYNFLVALKKGDFSRESIDSTLAAYNNSSAEREAKPETLIFDVILKQYRL